MSPRSTDNSARPSASTRSRSTYSEQDSIDWRLKHLREEVLPLYPFLLTVPTDVPFRLGNRIVNNWAVSDDGPFAPEEQQLQYMTFLTHDESDSLLVAVGDWSDATGSVMADPRSRPQSATSTPSSSSTKKKISLHDYKNKRKSGTSPSPLSQDTPGRQGGPAVYAHRDNHISKHIPTSDSRQKPPKTHLSPTPPSQLDSEHVDRKRAPERDLGRHALQVKDNAPAKKRKLSPEAPVARPKTEPSNANGLPELLSPTLPPTSSTPRLPRLLSPTLPPDLERELAKIGNESLASDSQPESTVNSDSAKQKQLRDKASACDISQLESITTNIPNFHSSSEKCASREAESVKASSHAFSKTSIRPQMNSRPLQTLATKPIQSSVRSRLIVKLKYGRSNRKRVEGLLKFAGKRKLSHQSSPTPDVAERELSHSTKPEQPKVPTSDQIDKTARFDGKTKLTGGNRANYSTRDRAKESRLPSVEKPQTPVLSQVQQEKSRPVSITPAKDLKHSSRYEPVTNDRKEHSRPGSRKTPADPSPSTITQSPSQSNSADRNAERRAWKDEYQKYGNLGRELKHAADRHTAKDKVANTDEKLAAATAIEAIICFVLAFIAEDQSKAISRQIGDSSTWLSIIAYWRVVKKNSLPYPPLHSLCLILGAISYDAIHSLDLERLAITPIPGEQTPLSNPVSDGQPAQLEDSKRGLKDFLELKSRLPECYRESQRLWYDGYRGLSEDILAREFPETWSKRARNYTEQGRKRLKPGDYSGEIYLPLGRTSTPLEIVRFSYSLLSEWCSKENIEWQGKLDL
ncbi:hypothetical protein ASPVEDRAFT_140012 [Aspergillus versicolor CBS 583.65]|uniref:Ell binding protein Ebp1 C-terminal domain-containing protein n=1 Tax=Aspergillus versicolor CBS 583.65 TaxID=1036611 RepID=A0A1L9PY19_ASPVE|nr:uncharacterized protein ASPVEDRAFT_140012 [Aspergillus versicolor CBS 583.65]OJJ06417.1 hypothetical protein ASPVEDRAFT_140012 [Aspergillus versicolor CBS 583.65]